MNNRWYNDELYHYGVLGMKWGQRKKPDLNNGEFTRKDFRYARKQISKNKKKGIDFKSGKNYIKAENRMIAELNRTYNKKKHKITEKNIDDDSTWDYERDIPEKALKYVHEAMLLDLGFSKKKAKAGAAWTHKRRLLTYSPHNFTGNDLEWTEFDGDKYYRRRDLKK